MNRVTLRKLTAGFELLSLAGDDTPSHDGLTRCRGFSTPQSGQLVLLGQATVPPGHVHKQRAFSKQEAAALQKKNKRKNQKFLLTESSIRNLRGKRIKGVPTHRPLLESHRDAWVPLRFSTPSPKN